MRPAVPAARSPAPTLAPAAMALLAAGAWVVAVRRMDGMDMGAATELGPLGPFLATWAPMMAAMMLPGAIPAVADRARAGTAAALGFAASYLLVWAAAGVAVHALYRPHGTLAAGAVTVAAGLYELTPLKRAGRRRCRDGAASGLAYGGWCVAGRRRCRDGAASGLAYGGWCVASSAGLMALLLALGAMNVGWMAVVGGLVLAQKLLPPADAVDVPLAIAIVALGVLAAAAPAAVPGLMPAM